MSLDQLNPITHGSETKLQWRKMVKIARQASKNPEISAAYAGYNPDEASTDEASTDGGEDTLPESLLQWLDEQSPEIENLSKLSYIDRIMIGNNKPTEDYDIMPEELQSELFMVKFDMDNPCGRFLILHRQMGQEYRDLLPKDKREFLRVALDCVHHYGFCDSFLSLPMGASDQTGIIYSTFYAYITVPDIERYLKVFKKFSSDGKIPSWPSFQWVTPLWRPDSNPDNDPDCFADSVYFNTGSFPNRDVHRLRRKRVLLRCPKMKRKVSSADICNDFDVVISPKDSVVGVFSNQFTTKKLNELERCQFLDFMSRKLARYLRKRTKCQCTIKISLAATMILKNIPNVIGLIKFEDQLPTMFLKKECRDENGNLLRKDSSFDSCRGEGSTSEDQEVKRTKTGPDGTILYLENEDHWILIDDKTLDQKTVKIKFYSRQQSASIETVFINVYYKAKQGFNHVSKACHSVRCPPFQH